MSLASVTFILLFIYSVAEMYLIYLETPYFKFVRDTLSYIVLVVLHYALCLSPSTIAFSALEWAILVFFIGRYLVERKQIWNILQRIEQRIEQRIKNGDVEAQSKWIRLKTLSIYLRWLIIYRSCNFFVQLYPHWSACSLKVTIFHAFLDLNFPISKCFHK